MGKASCIHELDVVRLTMPAKGWGPVGEVVSVPKGAQGTVVREQSGSPWVEVEIMGSGSDPSDRPVALVEVTRDSLEVTWHATRQVA